MMNFLKLLFKFLKTSSSGLLLFVLLFDGLIPDLFGQEQTFSFEHIGQNEGLPNSSIRCILQDSAGFLWFGSQSGLIRFDGKHFKTFRNEPGDTTSISNNTIWTLFEHRNKLFVGTVFGGLSILDLTTNTAHSYQYKKDVHGTLAANDIKEIKLIGNSYYIATSRGICISRADEPFHFITLKHDANVSNSLSSDETYCVESDDRDESVFIGTFKGGLNRYYLKTGMFKHYLHTSDNKHSIAGNIVYSITKAGGGMYWIATNAGLERFDSNTETFALVVRKEGGSSDDEINCLMKDRDGNIWFGTTNNGIYIYTKDNSTIHLLHDEKRKESLSGNDVYSMLQDKTGGIWIGTMTGGLNYCMPKQNLFNFIPCDKKSKGDINDEMVLSVYEDPFQNVWIGGLQNGLYELRNTDHNIINYKHQEHNPNSICGNAIFASYYSERWKLYFFGTRSDGLSIYDALKDRFTTYLDANDSIFNQTRRRINCILESKSGMLYFGANCLISYDVKEKKFGYYLLKYDNTHDKLNSYLHASAMAEDDEGNIWITSSAGVQIFNPKTKAMKVFVHDAKDATTISSNDVFGIVHTRKGQTWITTAGGGLNYYDPTTKSFKIFTEKNGLSDNTLYGIMEVANGDLWMVGSNGLIRFAPPVYPMRATTLHCSFYTSQDKLPVSNFVGSAYCSGKSGKIYVGGTEGLMYFQPDSLLQNKFVPPVVLTDFYLFNNRVGINDSTKLLTKDIAQTRGIKMNYQQNFFGFEFAALSFYHSAKNEFAYMLEGVDKDWIKTGINDRASYTGVPPGDYVFRVKACNNDGLWNEIGTSIKIIITPPWWQTIWFRILVVVVCIGLIYLSFKIYANRKLMKQRIELEKLQNIMNERSRIASELHDDLGSGLTKISMMSQLAGKTSGEKQQGTLDKITTESSDMVDKMNGIIWAMNSQNDSLPNLLSFIKINVFEMYEDSTIKLLWNTPASIPEIPVYGETRRNIYLVVKEALHNVLKYSDATQAIVNMILINDELTIIIEDNGKGFDASPPTPLQKRGEISRKGGNGLLNMKRRMEEIDGAFDIASKMGSGTKVSINIPLKYYTKV